MRNLRNIPKNWNFGIRDVIFIIWLNTKLHFSYLWITFRSNESFFTKINFKFLSQFMKVEVTVLVTKTRHSFRGALRRLFAHSNLLFYFLSTFFYELILLNFLSVYFAHKNMIDYYRKWLNCKFKVNFWIKNWFFSKNNLI